MSYPAQEPQYTITVLKYKILLAAQLDERLSGADTKCLAYLLERYNQAQKAAWPSYRAMSEDLGLGSRQPKYSIARLLDLEYLEKIEQGGRGRNNRYRPMFERFADWNPDWCKKKGASDPAPDQDGADSCTHGGAQGCTQDGARDCTRTISREPGTENHTQRPTRPSRVCPFPDPTKEEAEREQDELTPDEVAEFIQLLAEKQAENPGAYRTVLERKLRRGELTYSRGQLQELRGATQAAQDPQRGQARESEADRQRRDQVSKAIDRELQQGAGAKTLLWQVFRGEFLAEERDFAESELARRIPETYEAEKAKHSLVRSGRTAMQYPRQAEKRLPRIIERLASLDGHLAAQLRDEWTARRAELGLKGESQDTGAEVEG